jgi:protein gp37
MAKRLAGRYGYPESPHEFDVTLHHDKWREPLRWRKPRTVFVCSMSDLFHEDVDEYFRAYLWSVMCAANRHTFIVLTKRAKNMHDWIVENEMDAPPNIWLGVTAENQQRADERIPWLLRMPAAVRFVSVEPMLGPVTLNEDWFYELGYYQTGHGRCEWCGWFQCSCGRRAYEEEEGYSWLYLGLRWIICGAETGPGARPMDLAWARDLRDQCKAAGVPFFWKRPSPGTEAPSDLMVREWP